VETRRRKRNGDEVAGKPLERQVRIAGQLFVLGKRDVRRALRNTEPEPIMSHFVVIGTRRFPPKQVISAVTGLDRADFTTHQARRTLMRLGYSAGRRGGGALASTASGSVEYSVSSSPSATGERLADRLRPLAGQWVAIKEDDVLHTADTPQRLVGWLGEHGQKADSVFRVREDELAATGLAPL
jgi:hypothetical protein